MWETPQKHPSLSAQEKLILEAYPPRGNAIKGASEQQSKAIPWLAIISSWQIYPVVLIYFGYNWPFYLMINSLPTYLQTVLGFKSSKQGLLSMLPYIFLWISLISSGMFSDWLVKKKKVPIWLQRKGMVFLGLFPSAIVLLFLSHFSSSVFWTLAAINFSIAMPGISMSGFSPAAFDLSSEYAGAITSICNVFGSLSGIICPIVTGIILDQANCSAGRDENPTASLACKHAWFTAFAIGGGVYIAVTLIWVLFASFKSISFSHGKPCKH